MPHLVIYYTPNLDDEIDMRQLCRTLADVMLAQTDEAAQPVFPRGGTRVLAYPATHFAISDGGAAGRAAGGSGDYAFAYLNLRMGRGRSSAVHQQVGLALQKACEAFFQPVFQQRHIGVTVQVDEGTEVFDVKLSNLHPLFNKS
jgi:5-carboxymethyl-2-hydroxymuconate isomerase